MNVHFRSAPVVAVLIGFWLVCFGAGGFAQKSLEGEQPTMTREAFLKEVAAGQIIRGQSVSGEWLMAALNEAAKTPGTNVSLYLDECRVLGSAYLLPREVTARVLLTQVIFDRDLTILDG